MVEKEMAERHHSHSEFNNEYREVLARHGMHFSALSWLIYLVSDRIAVIIRSLSQPKHILNFTSRPNRPNHFCGLVQYEYRVLQISR